MAVVVRETLKRQFADTLDLRPDVVLDYATINLVGNIEAEIINHKGLVLYTTTSIKTRSSQGMIEISGQNLEIVFFSAQEMKIVGKISQVMFK